jgi:hypothetical protein
MRNSENTPLPGHETANLDDGDAPMSDTYSPVPELNQLWDFDDQEDRAEYYAEGFELTGYADNSGLEAGWSKDPGFLRQLIPFAQANGTGSFYAFWRVDGRTDLATLPVVVFGDEGGEHVIARSLRELFQLLAYDTEITVDGDSAYFYRDTDHRPSAHHQAFADWLDEHFGLAVVDDPDAVIAAAQAEFGERFAQWKARYLPQYKP